MPPPPGATATQPPPGVPGSQPTAAYRAPAQTPILGNLAREPEPWYRRLEPKYIALIVAGVLVLGGGGAYGVTQLTGNDAASPGTAAQVPGKSGKKAKKKSRQPAVTPGSVTFAVLNATTVSGAANRTADTLEAKGYHRGNVLTANEQGRAESVVEYADSNVAAARLIGRDLGITQIEKIDPQTQLQAGDANVVVILGADKAPAAAG
jgi:hypothetical protein